MEIIKFRAKPLDPNYLESKYGRRLFVFFELHESYKSGDAEVFYVDGIACRTGTEQQFTGLLDKNGNEIYDGDIVQYEKWGGGMEKYAIMWHQKEAHWIHRELNDIKDMEYCGHTIGFSTAREMEIIGNMHENPELLK